jgi:hypothetical protein
MHRVDADLMAVVERMALVRWVTAPWAALYADWLQSPPRPETEPMLTMQP